VFKIEDRIEGLATKVVAKMVPKKFFDKPVPQQVLMMHKAIGATSVANVRKRLLMDIGMPSDFKDRLKEGLDREGIKNYYWQHPEFVELWTKTLEMTEGIFDQLLDDTLNKGE